MAAVVTTAKLSPYTNAIDRTTALLALYAGATDEKAALNGILALLILDESVAMYYNRVAIDARIAAI